MSAVAYRAGLVRKIENAMKQATIFPDPERDHEFQDGQLDAYAHILLLVKDDDL